VNQQYLFVLCYRPSARAVPAFAHTVVSGADRAAAQILGEQWSSSFLSGLQGVNNYLVEIADAIESAPDPRAILREFCDGCGVRDRDCRCWDES